MYGLSRQTAWLSQARVPAFRRSVRADAHSPWLSRHFARRRTESWWLSWCLRSSPAAGVRQIPSGRRTALHRSWVSTCRRPDRGSAAANAKNPRFQSLSWSQLILHELNRGGPDLRSLKEAMGRSRLDVTERYPT